MKPLEYTFDLDFLDETSQIFCNVRKGDDCSKLIVSLREDGKPYQIENYTSIAFAAVKPDNNTIYDTDCQITNNTIVYNFTNQTALASGTVVCQFVLVGSDSKRLRTPIFRLEVSDNVNISETNIVSSDSYMSFESKLGEMEAALEAVNNLSATVTKSGSVATISITNTGGTTTTATVSDGEKGDKGDKGDKGNPGADGFSPTATVTKLGHTATITIIDKNGTTTVPIYDGDASNKMDLAPLNPTAEQIAALSNGQLYGDTVNHKGIIKGGQSFYDTVYIDENYRKTYTSVYNPPIFVPKSTQETIEDSIFKKGDRWINSSASVGTGVYVLREITVGTNRFHYKWVPEYEIWYRKTSGDAPHSVQIINEAQYQQGVRGWYETPNYLEGAVLYEASAELGGTIQKIYKCYATRVSGYQLLTYWAEISVPENYYTKTEIDSMIPTVPTNISAFTNDSGYLTLATLPIYDGTVI